MKNPTGYGIVAHIRWDFLIYNILPKPQAARENIFSS